MNTLISQDVQIAVLNRLYGDAFQPQAALDVAPEFPTAGKDYGAGWTQVYYTAEGPDGNLAPQRVAVDPETTLFLRQTDAQGAVTITPYGKGSERYRQWLELQTDVLNAERLVRGLGDIASIGVDGFAAMWRDVLRIPGSEQVIGAGNIRRMSDGLSTLRVVPVAMIRPAEEKVSAARRELADFWKRTEDQPNQASTN